VTYDQLFYLDGDLARALNAVVPKLPSAVVAVLATIDGEHEGDGWHWLVRLECNQYAYIAGGCDYSAGADVTTPTCEAFVEPSLESAIRQVPEPYRLELLTNLVKTKKPLKP